MAWGGKGLDNVSNEMPVLFKFDTGCGSILPEVRAGV
jgi:hypothetical protein